ncbi:TetR family transcriptional regulator [Burkholderia pseudomallei]|uniref:TetR/AcrR family transcriptional regulator n=1 Tax=Burkholderia pseudomallei TaxID=28450 RepID=UPI000F05A6B2|nr:TetR/AcrR family transcriptional regulator [Burkholderia pseudomallei]MCW0140737.1 TetR/AcrR family transcriptional regulator [Burkholderia pseudomallei]CAJ2870712.1 TetR family transcriptional regulator [Burkholderia pseudomallei]CAJ3507410.1 TetR family transcriptional regulator [Burkholderia pseudomallei]CAJ3631909.1 TetR family transcriptional regulator [Burkholderia pseudomallei]CAJ4788383.1 TetR family transcriptional regulator [Burkholderia pseudomallei]
MRNRNGDEQAATARHEAPARSPRCRLPADIRINQILDAALAEFSASGFAGARIDDIAARAGMSKGGVYTHFGSKDEIFEALLARTLMPPLPAASSAVRAARRAGAGPAARTSGARRAAQASTNGAGDADERPGPGEPREPGAIREPGAAGSNAAAEFPDAPPPVPDSLAAIVDLLTGDLYTWATSEPVIAMLRLLIAESRRAPRAVERWRKHVEQAFATAVGRLVRQGVDAGELRDGIAARAPLLLVAPLTQACLRRALRAAPPSRREVAASRRDYARFIEALLT